MPSTYKNLGKFAIGSTNRIRFTINKDGVAWENIDSVTLTFKAPDGTETNRSATLEGTNIWYYDTITTEYTALGTGNWELGVTVVDGTITQIYPDDILITVVDQP